MKKIIVDRPIFLERLNNVIKQDARIIDGNYGSTMELRLQVCDTVFFLDYPLDVCLDGVKERRGKARTDMPWVETEEDAEFVEYIKTFNAEHRPVLMALLDKYADKEIYIFKSRDEADSFLEQV